MKLHVLADLHLEFGTVEIPASANIPPKAAAALGPTWGETLALGPPEPST